MSTTPPPSAGPDGVARPRGVAKGRSRRAAPWCALVGAGPGDPELLTLKALRLMRRATLLLVDDLVSDAVLALALQGRGRPPRVVMVGKRGGCTSTPQAFIERLMVAEALAGERVVRIKGGDPFLFGRGGEEVQALRQAGVTVEVASGITAAVAASAALGVPLTHRDHAHGVMLVTGHPKPGAAALHWPTLAAAAAQGLTLVVYMGVARLGELQAGLLQGLPAHTPAAIVQHASLPQQRSAVTTLGTLAQTVTDQGLGSPAVLIIGDVLQGLAALAQAQPQHRPHTLAA
ncbi:MAG: uroporphyrinogen-III C-methyltransferase [Burkholderiales bacterium PBB5]|nr:MAG: uroporphyrinogen-III C-methyltransferase [Burkholderiales bacterium PBB5]